MAESIKKPVKDEIATTSKDIDIFGGWLKRLENPDPVLRTEASGRGLKLYDDVARDPHAGSVLQTRYLAIAGCEWEINPAGDSARDKEIAAFLDTELHAINFTQALQELMAAALYGYFVSEIMWQQKDGRWRPSQIMGKHPRRFSFDLDRSLRLLTPENMIEGEVVPERKFIVFTFGSSDNPYGSGLGQKLWWPVWFKKHGIKYWLVFLEKFGMPTGVGKYPPGTDPTDQAKLLDAIDAIQNETGIAIPNNMVIDLLEASRSGNVTYEALCDYMDQQMSKAVLGQTLTTQVSGGGSLAAGQVHNEVRQDLKKADADLLSEVLNNTLIRWMVDYNFADVTAYPSLRLRTEAEKDLKALAERDEILINKIGLRVSQNYFYETYNIPEPDNDADIVAPSNEAGKIYEYHLKYGVVDKNEIRGKIGLPPKTGGDKPPVAIAEDGASEFAEPGRFTPDQNELEALAAAGIASDPFAANEEKILASVLAAGDYDDAMARVLALYPDMDVETASDMMARCLVAAGAFGNYTVKEENDG
jgi:phage gp29-like protein